jgi:hypothetical protein
MVKKEQIGNLLKQIIEKKMANSNKFKKMRKECKTVQNIKTVK